MNRKTMFTFGVVLAALAICSFVTFAVAQPKPEGKPEAKPAETKQPPKAEPKTEAAPEKTMTGKLTDLHCFMCGGPKAGEDPAKCAADCIKAGVPAILEVGKDIYILSKGPKGGGEFSAMAMKEVEVKGKVFEKAGLKYIDVTSITAKGGEKKAEVKPAEAKPAEAKPEPKPTEKKPEPPKTK